MNIEAIKLEMSLHCYGYGRWDAPLWFLGPEQGMSKDEDELDRRIKIWFERRSLELDDCQGFHRALGENRWHGRDSNDRAILQKTWAKLMLVTMAYPDELNSPDERRDYQINRWGSLCGSTCVIELSGLAANNHGVERDSESFLSVRINHILEKMQSLKPRFVVLYGQGRNGNCEKAWQALTSMSGSTEDFSFSFAKIRRCGPTLVAWAPHPRGQTNRDWIELGRRLRNLEHAEGEV